MWQPYEHAHNCTYVITSRSLPQTWLMSFSPMYMWCAYLQGMHGNDSGCAGETCILFLAFNTSSVFEDSSKE